MWQRFTPDARQVILRAQNIAIESQLGGVSTIQFFLALLEIATPDSDLGGLLLSAGLKREEARLYVEAAQEHAPDARNLSEPKLTPDAKRALEMTAAEARRLGSQHIGPEHILLGCLHPRVEPNLMATLAPLGWDLDVLRTKQRELNARPNLRSNPLGMLTGNSKKAVDAAYAAMRATWCGHISTAHLLLGVLEDERVRELVTEVGVSPEELKARTRSEIRSDSRLATSAKRFDAGAKRALYRAQRYAFSGGYKFIGPEHILLGLLPRRATLREMIQLGLSVPDQAAPLLVELNASKLRALVPTTTSQPAPRPQKPSADVPANAIGSTFFLMIVAGIISGMALITAGRVPTPLQAVGILLFVALLLTTSIGACWMLVVSRKPNLKYTWVAAFGGFMVGAMVTTLLLAR